MKVELITITTGVGEAFEGKTIDELIVGQARVSTSREINELFDEPHKLLRHCILNAHWSIFSLANLGFRIETSRAMGRELIRHGIQTGLTEFCISGDSKLTFITPSGSPYKMSIKNFYEKWHFGSKPIVKKGKVFDTSSIEDNKMYSTQDLSKFGFNKTTLRNKAIKGEMPYEKGINRYQNECYYFLGSDLKNVYNTDRSITFDLKNRLSKVQLKAYDIESGTFTTTLVKDVFFNGVKPVYEVTLENGMTITCTKEHKFFNGTEFAPLEDIISLEINDDLSVKSFEKNYVAKNGIPLYQSKEHLLQAKEEALKTKSGLKYIAEKFDISSHTIRKWLKIHSIQFTKKEASSMYDPWNKDKSGYKVKPRSLESRIKQSLSTPKGADHHSYRGGGKGIFERDLIQKYINSKRALIYKNNGGIFCSKCKIETYKLDLHHIEEVTRNPAKAYDVNNITPLCKKCHIETHRELAKIPYETIHDLTTYNWDKIRPIDYSDYSPISYRKSKVKTEKSERKKQTFILKKVVDVKFVGLEECYDLETVNDNHNYIANGILVHNSQRYSGEIKFEDVELREQAVSNRQSSTEVVGLFTQEQIQEQFGATYDNLISRGVARECARMFLPEATKTTIYMNFRVRELITFLNARLHHTAQKEIRLLAEEVKKIFIEKCPIISKCLFNFEYAEKFHILEQVVLEKYKLRDQVINENR
jgi:thymidylate synthase (FAD)